MDLANCTQIIATEELRPSAVRTAWGEGSSLEQTEGPLCGYRFLIVEDEVMQAWQISGIIADAGGAVVMIAYGFDQARDALKEAEFDCAIVDLNLAGIYAYNIADTLRRRGIPFVFCSAYADGADVFTSLSDVPRLGKPVNRQELCAALLGVLQRSAAKQR